MSVDPHILLLGHVLWKWAGYLSHFVLFQLVVLWVFGSLLVGRPLSGHQLENFIHYIFSYAPGPAN